MITQTRRVNPFTLEGFLEVLRRNLQAVSVTVCIGVLIALIFYYRTPRTYGSEITVLIPTGFFAASGQLTDGANTPDSELDAYRLIYAREVLNDNFLDTVGELYNVFEYALDDPKHSLERQAFRARFQISIASQSTIRIATTSGTAHEVAEMLNDYFKELLKVLRQKIPSEGDVPAKSLATLMEGPEVPYAPLTPNIWDFLNVGIMLGLLVGLFQLMYREYRITQYMFPEEVATFLGIDFLGELPQISRLEWLYLLDHVRAAQQKLITRD